MTQLETNNVRPEARAEFQGASANTTHALEEALRHMINRPASTGHPDSKANDAGHSGPSQHLDFTPLPGYGNQNKPGDSISVTQNNHHLSLGNGDQLNIDQNGAWKMTDKNGNEAKVLPQLTRELRQPPWLDMSNGATFYPFGTSYSPYGQDGGAKGNPTIKYPDGTEIKFDNTGIKSVNGIRFEK